MAHELLLRGYLKTTGDEYRLVKLTERLEEVLSGERFFMKMAKVEPASGGAGKGKEKERRKKAPAAGMGEQEEMLRVSGVGEHKLEKYGERFLSEIREF